MGVDISLVNAYRWYRKENPRILSEEQLNVFKDTQRYNEDRQVYLGIVFGMFKFIMSKVLKAYDVRLGAKLGIIGIRGRKIQPIIDKDGNIKGIAPDWGATKKLQATNEEARTKRTIVYCFNEHSDGIKYKLYWGTRNVIVKNRSYYSITFSRQNRRTLAKAIKDGQEYLILQNKKK
jgi:hypothetical protein